MFLNKSTKRMASAFGRDDRGSAMVSILGVMSVIAIISVTVLSATMNAMGTTSSTRAGVQARAAAEAGVDVATVGLQTINSCASVSGVYTSATGAHPQFESVVSFDAGAGWVTGCPTDDADLVRIMSTGTALSVGIAGATAGDEVTLEAIYNYEPIIVNVPLAGSAVYAHEIQGALKKFTLNSPSNSLATSVSIKHGNVDCTNGAKIGGDLILEDGSANLDMCDITGKLHVSGNATIYKSNIGGDVKAGGSVSITGGSTVGGSVTYGVSVAPPVVPDWVNINGDASFWEPKGFTVVQWAGPCTIKGSTTDWKTTLEGFTTPTVIDFRTACPNSALTVESSSVSATIKTNLVFVAEQFNFKKLYLVGSAPNTTATFVVPDKDMTDSVPTCLPPAPLDGSILMESEFDLGTNIAALIYTPCKITSMRDGFRGQMYGGEVEFEMQASLTFVPVTIPGVDFSNGVTEAVQSGAELGAYVSLREVA